MTKEEMIKALQEQVMVVVYDKKDGTERQMTATLHEGIIPDAKKPKGVKAAQPESSVIRAFDVELQEFRSINSDTVKFFQPVTAVAADIGQ